MEYRTTKQQCAESIKGVCSRCGGELEPIETVDNGGNPTYWSGCESCCCFDNGVPPEVYQTAKQLVDEGHKAYSHARSDPKDNEELREYKKQQQTGGVCRIVLDVLRVYSNNSKK